ncbi:ABC transporter permease [Nakamurella sp. A5-74]|uniref:ABC transporter permease n=1 Tax=Nakamurella sp. A5-74 TaxID=3158264 RepID=A0AAU8DLZ6_9ACTN
MIGTWTAGLIRHRAGRLGATAAGIALAVGLVASLGTFLTASENTMTRRAVSSVIVPWQIEVQRGADAAAMGTLVRAEPGVAKVEAVQFASTSGFESTGSGTTQTTGPGVVLGISPTYRSTFPDEFRTLTGATTGALLAQQTAANLHAGPGDTIRVRLAGGAWRAVTIAGIIDLPQADSLFQRIGAPPQSQPSAPPDNVLVLPQNSLNSLLGGTAGASVGTTEQFHVTLDPLQAHDPAAAYTATVTAAHHLEAASTGGTRVGNNVGAALDAARKDARYAELLFLFLGLPGVILAALITAGLVGAGANRRREEQALLRLRGLRPRDVATLAAVEAAIVGVVGGLLGLALASVAGSWAFSSLSVGSSGLPTVGWAVAAVAAGLVVTAITVLLPATADLRGRTVVDTRRQHQRRRGSWWSKIGLDVLLIVSALLIFRAAASDNYSLVLAPEGVASISVSYWAFLGPALLWLGTSLLLWRLTNLLLRAARRPLTAIFRPVAGALAPVGAAGMARRRRPLATAVVLLALAVSFAISTATFTATYQQQAEVDAVLTNGADVTVTQPPGTISPPSAGDRLSSIRGVKHVEPLQHRFAYVGSDLQDLYGVRPDTITDATALQDAYFVGGSARQMMGILQTKPDSILVSDETVKDFQLAPGDLVNLRLPDSRTHALITVPFHYAGIVTEFPTAPKDSFFVANAAYIATATGSDAVGSFLLDTSGADPAAVAADIRTAVGTSASVTDITQTRLQVGSSLTSVNLTGLTQLELAFAILLAAAAGALVMWIGLAERRRSRAIMTVIGARRRQLTGLVISEAIPIAALGTFGGLVISWALSQMLVKVLTGVFDPPPSSIAVPWTYVALVLVSTVLTLGLAAVISTRRSNRPPIEELRDL